jgi:hypothetical protein
VVPSIVRSWVKPLFYSAPPVPANTRLVGVKTEDVILAKWVFDPLTIIFFQVAINVYYKSMFNYKYNYFYTPT